MFGVIWRCLSCKLRVLELCPLGPEFPEPGACLSCGGELDPKGCCRECGSDRAAMVARVRERCGALPALDTINDLADEGLFSLAINAVDLRLEQLQNDPPTLVVKAKLMSEIGRSTRAVPLLRRAIDLGVDEPGVAIDLGVALANSDEHEQALRVYEAHLLVETDGFRRAVTLSNAGGCLSALGRVDEAEAYHRRAIETDATHLGPRWNLFANLFRRKRYADALEVVEQTIALTCLETSERENLHAYRAEMLIALERYREALEAIDASLASDPEELARLGTRARILVHLGQHEAARACLAKLMLLDPDSVLARRLLNKIERRTPGPSRN
jgi:tetratricopeptide (TPR) repeat protein